MSQGAVYSVCNIPVKQNKKTSPRNHLYRFNNEGFGWKGVKPERYKPAGNDFHSIIRHVILGHRGENLKFHLRYFEIAPGGYSSYEIHRHEHVVICIRGRGKVKLGKRSVALQPYDVLYIAPNKAHRLYNPYNEPFGFFCIVNAKRDRPKPVDSKNRSVK